MSEIKKDLLKKGWKPVGFNKYPLKTRLDSAKYYLCSGRKRVHVIVAEGIIGRMLKSGEVVHHKDFNKLNNHPDNLAVMTKSEHARLHALERRHYAATV